MLSCVSRQKLASGVTCSALGIVLERLGVAWFFLRKGNMETWAGCVGSGKDATPLAPSTRNLSFALGGELLQASVSRRALEDGHRYGLT